MSNRPIYDGVLYKKLLDEKVIELSRQFLGKKYWGNKKNHVVIVAYDFIPSNRELKQTLFSVTEPVNITSMLGLIK